jgi:hypothetical protein
VDTAGSAAVMVGRGAAAVVVEVVAAAGVLVVVLGVAGAIETAPLFVVEDMLLRRVRS